MAAAGTEHEEMLRHARLACWFTGLLTVVLAFATAFRPLISDVGALFTLIGTVNTLLFGASWWAMRSGHVVERAPHLLMTLATVLALPLILISGGTNSQFAPLVPLFPICGVLLGGRRLAIGVAAFWILALPAAFLAAQQLPDLTGEPFHAPKASSRALWLVLATGVSLTFALHFDQVSRRFAARLLAMAERDPLTGVGNRRALDAALTRSLAFAARQGGWVTLAILDLDRFKRFNDSRGHAEGDRALVRIAETLVAQCRAGQDTVARFGGEEFVLVLAQTEPEAARVAAEKIRRAVRDLGLRYDDVTPDVLTVTVGYTSVRGDEAVDHDELLRRADAALYAGKWLGRDRIVAAEDLDEAEARVAAEAARRHRS